MTMVSRLGISVASLDGNEHTGTGQRETQTIITHGGEWVNRSQGRQSDW